MVIWGDTDSYTKNPEETYFVTKLFSGSETNLSIDMQTMNMKKVSLRPVDTLGNPLDDQKCGNISYFAYKHDEDNIPVGSLIRRQSPFNMQHADIYELWVEPGSYTFTVNTMGEYKTFSYTGLEAQDTNDKKDAYFLKARENITENKDIIMGGSNLVKVSLNLPANTSSGSIRYSPFGMALYTDGLQYSGVMSPGEGCYLYVTPDNYTAQAIVTKLHYQKEWNYLFEKEFQLTNGTYPWDIDFNFQAQIIPSKKFYLPGEAVTTENAVVNNSGSRLVAIDTNLKLFDYHYRPFEQLSQALALDESNDIAAQNHNQLAPFVVIKNTAGNEVARLKNADNSYQMAQWCTANYIYEGPRLARLGSWDNTFYGGTWTPDSGTSGQFNMFLEAGVGPEGTVTSDPVSIAVGIGGIEPVKSPTNTDAIKIKGTTIFNTEVKLYIKKNDGEFQPAGTLTSGPDGSFEKTINLPAEGNYEFKFSILFNEVTKYSNPVACLIDRTQPKAPESFTAEGVSSKDIRLKWRASSDQDVFSYKVFREVKGSGSSQLIAEKSASSTSLPGEYGYIDSGLMLGVEYQYTLKAVDKAGNTSLPITVLAHTVQTEDTEKPTVPGEFKVTLLTDGRAKLSWNASRDNVKVTGYKVYRSEKDGETKILKEIYAAEDLNTFEYIDDSLNAATEYTYYVVSVDSAFNASLPSGKVTVVTPDLQVTQIKYMVVNGLQNNCLPQSAQLAISLKGDTGRVAQAEIVYLSWFDEEGNMAEDDAHLYERKSVITLEENQNEKGTYFGYYKLLAPSLTSRTGVAAVKSVTGFIKDTAGHQSRVLSCEGFPKKVASTVNVSVEGEGQEVLKNAHILVYSDKEKSGKPAFLNGNKVYSIEGLIPSDDYRVSLIKSDGSYAPLKGPDNNIVMYLSGIKAPAGMSSDVAVRSGIASLDIRVVDDFDNPVKGVTVNLFEKDYKYLTGGKSNDFGRVISSVKQSSLFNNGIEGQIVKVNVVFSNSQKLTYLNQFDVILNGLKTNEAVLKLDENVLNIKLKKRPMTFMEGTVVDANGSPVKEARLQALINLDGFNFFTIDGRTGENGTFRITLPMSPFTFNISTDWCAKEYNVTNGNIIDGKIVISENNMFVLDNPPGLKLALWVKMIGEEHEKLVNLDWRTSEQFGINVYNITKNISVRHSVDSADYTRLFGCDPGDRIRISVDGSKAGMNNSTVEAVIGQDSSVNAKLHLVEYGKIRARVKISDAFKDHYMNRTIELFDKNGNRKFTGA
ncbi:MAG: hypothetical protein N2645_21425 [Clostridia bacterium]|nr:hypothetical protein [Clostridia bacterium]